MARASIYRGLFASVAVSFGAACSSSAGPVAAVPSDSGASGQSTTDSSLSPDAVNGGDSGPSGPDSTAERCRAGTGKRTVGGGVRSQTGWGPTGDGPAIVVDSGGRAVVDAGGPVVGR